MTRLHLEWVVWVLLPLAGCNSAAPANGSASCHVVVSCEYQVFRKNWAFQEG